MHSSSRSRIKALSGVRVLGVFGRYEGSEVLAVIDCLVGGFQGQLELRRCLFGRPFLRALPAEELPYGQTATLKTELATPLERTANEI
jgi:hypothetical protein